MALSSMTKETLPIAIKNGAEKLKVFGTSGKEIAKTVALSTKNNAANVINGIDYYIAHPNLFKSEDQYQKQLKKHQKKFRYFSNYLGDIQESFSKKT